MSWHGQWAGWRAAVPVALWLLATGSAGTAAAQAARPTAELAACVAANKQAYAELVQAQDGEVRRHALHAVLVARLQGLGGLLASLRAATARSPRNLAECEKTTQSLTEAREQLERIAGSPAQAAECAAANRQNHAEMQATLLGLQPSAQVTAPTLEAAARRLDILRGAVAREGASLADCRQLATDLAAERTQLQRLVPPAPRPVAASAPAVVASAPAPSPAACREAQARSYNEVAQAYARLVGGGSIPVEWMGPLHALSERLTRLHASIANPAAPGWDCEATANALAQARSELAGMARR